MNVSQTMPTEESLTCLHIKLYHPDQAVEALYQHLPLNRHHKMNAEDPVRLGRDGQTCSFVLNDLRVSRKQISFFAYRKTGSTDLHFTVQNISQRGKIIVNGCELGYLERVDLEDKALLRFGKYEMLVFREPGEAQDSFEVLFQKQNIPPSREMGMDIPCTLAVMDTGVRNYHNGELVSQEPLESDETVYA
ncbi:TRAF-interacting protein with FHA domain-containing protein A [Astyanax mexicanus]|uniref:TRAF-interacting protein with FHA domain-containing protein A n=1 Tax=Astyanax mexicanus TaxID=7994 RepID=UPI0020CAE648|nr:TRAF-interacting protein with FHA domain-containing protein A [Astyanax mexicanus]